MALDFRSARCIVKALIVLSTAVLLTVVVIGCSPSEKTHARIVSGDLRYLYREWVKDGRPDNFEPTNYIFDVSSTYGTSNQYFVFTNTVSAEGTRFHCRFARRDATRFHKPGIMAISDEGVVLWIAADGMIVVAPETKNWSSEQTNQAPATR